MNILELSIRCLLRKRTKTILARTRNNMKKAGTYRKSGQK